MRKVGPAVAGVALILAVSACDLLVLLGRSSGTPGLRADVPSPATHPSASPAADPSATPATHPSSTPAAAEGFGDGDATSIHGPTAPPPAVDLADKEVRSIDVWRGEDYVIADSDFLVLPYTGATGSCLQLRGVASYTEGYEGPVGWDSASPSLVAIGPSGQACVVVPYVGAFGRVPITAVATGTGAATTKGFFIRVEATSDGEFWVD